MVHKTKVRGWGASAQFDPQDGYRAFKSDACSSGGSATQPLSRRRYEPESDIAMQVAVDALQGFAYDSKNGNVEFNGELQDHNRIHK